MNIQPATRQADQRPRDVVLVGYGEQARRFYHPALEQLSQRNPLRLRLVIDLADRAEAIHAFLAQRRLQPDRLLLLDPTNRAGAGLAPEAEHAFTELFSRGQLDRLLVITEPKAHKPYVLWGARHCVDVLCEKPLTAVDGLTGDEARAWTLYADYLDIARAVRDGRVVVMAPRRVHEGFRWITRYLREFIARFEVPITHVAGFHGEGVWNLPDEFLTRENHPYRYGYGKLLHSGYHYVDLVTRIALLNNALPDKAPDVFELSAQSTGPVDFFHQFDDERYRALLHTDRFTALLRQDPAAFGHLGETDVQVMGQFRQRGRTVTGVELSLMHTTVNTRSWNRLPNDLRQNGRLPRERLTVHVGHLLTLEATARYTAPGSTEPGPQNPFRIEVHRNSGLIGGPPFAEIRPGDGNALHLSEAARREILFRWLVGAEVDAEISDHAATVHTLSAIYASLARRRSGRDGLVRVPLRHEDAQLPSIAFDATPAPAISG